MNRLLIFLFGLVLNLTAHGQTGPKEFGKVSLDELTSTRCTIDSTAIAVVLFDVGKVDVVFGNMFERHIRIKILKKEAVDQWGNFSMFYSRKRVNISRVKGATYNLVNGKIIESTLESKSIFESKHNSSTNELKFALPNVVEGSVIEYSYLIRYGADVNLAWQYQQSIPTYWSEYIFRGKLPFESLVQGSVPITDHTETSRNGIKTNTWKVKNIPAFHEEPYSLPSINLIGTLNIYIWGSDSWEWIGHRYDYLETYGSEPQDTVFVNSTFKKIKIPAGAREAIDSIVHFVKKKVKWDGFTDKVPDRDFKEVFESSKGSSSEVNMMVMALLKRGGIKAYPVLISTRKNGILQMSHPSIDQLNDVIVLAVLPSKTGKEDRLLIDATDPKLATEFIPFRCHNGYGVLVSKNPELIPLVPPKSKTVDDVKLRFDPAEQTVIGEIEESHYGLFASDKRKDFQDWGLEKFTERMHLELPDLTDIYSVEYLDDSRKPLKIKMKVNGANGVSFSNDLIYLNPYLTSKIENTIFKGETRKLVIDFSPSFDQFYISKIDIPENYQVEEMPKSTSFTLTDGSAKFVYGVTLIGNTINFVSQLMVNRAVYQPDEYPTIREFFLRVIAKQEEQIVLRKK
ncbi:MAG: DUF3857 domain-containing protein [Bacteroidetes bacterium]|nr:DUF3857 domain-containing protein [Bacteroidota bacterium]